MAERHKNILFEWYFGILIFRIIFEKQSVFSVFVNQIDNDIYIYIYVCIYIYQFVPQTDHVLISFKTIPMTSLYSCLSLFISKYFFILVLFSDSQPPACNVFSCYRYLWLASKKFRNLKK